MTSSELEYLQRSFFQMRSQFQIQDVQTLQSSWGTQSKPSNFWRQKTSKGECQSYKHPELWDLNLSPPLGGGAQAQIQGRPLTDV